MKMMEDYLGGKLRKWQATISISSSGPEHSPIFRRASSRPMPRAVADLKYTTADADYLSRHFKRRDHDSCEHEKFFRLVNPTVEQVLRAIERADKWFGRFRKRKDWDGGAIQFVYAGHGNFAEGELVLKDDQLFRPSEFVQEMLNISSKNALGERLRISLLLDSCHSGEFGLRVLDRVLNAHIDELVPYCFALSCCPDESSYEDPSLGHGIFTYCFSSSGDIGCIGAQAIQPNNRMGPSLSIAAGPRGVGLLTGGGQNPVTYLYGDGHLQVGDDGFSIFSSQGATEQFLDLNEMRRRVLRLRNNHFEKIDGASSLVARKMDSDAARKLAKEMKVSLANRRR